MMIKVFFLEETDQVQRFLRRYRSSETHKCSATGSYCNAMAPLDRITQAPGSYISAGEWPVDDPRWPVKCEACGEAFSENDPKQLFTDRVYRLTDTGVEALGRSKPVGSIWDAWWHHDHRTGPDGRSLHCMTPGGEWFIDGRASNCTMKDDDVHRCWVRHGRPEDGTLHVDKNGNTCAAGAGSIQAGNYHGFLHNGSLTDA